MYLDAGEGISYVPSGRIAGGWDARPHEFPWMVIVSSINNAHSFDLAHNCFFFL